MRFAFRQRIKAGENITNMEAEEEEMWRLFSIEHKRAYWKELNFVLQAVIITTIALSQFLPFFPLFITGEKRKTQIYIEKNEFFHK